MTLNVNTFKFYSMHEGCIRVVSMCKCFQRCINIHTHVQHHQHTLPTKRDVSPWVTSIAASSDWTSGRHGAGYTHMGRERRSMRVVCVDCTD